MLINYLKIAFRNILRHKGYSFINIAGLSLGMACTILILLWVQDELNYDRFHKNAETLYRVEENQHYSGEVYHVNVTPYPAAPVFKEQIPEIVDATRYSWNFGLLIRYGDKAFFENDIRAVDASFLRMFTFPMIEGDSNTALDNPSSMVITAELAEKYFADEEPIGKVISANNKLDFVVTGVIDEIPNNSSLQFDMLVPFDFMKTIGRYNEFWGNNSIFTYVQLQEISPILPVNDKLTAVVTSHNESNTTDFLLAPFTGMHLYSYGGYGHRMGNIQYVYIFTVVAVFVLLLACINFMNLSTARSANRAKEIGMRKVAGAFRSNLAVQFLGESILLAFLALVVASCIVMLLLPVFNELSGKEISIAMWSDPAIILGLMGITLFTGIIAGSYPAMFLSAFKPVSVLKGSIKSGSKSSSLRKILVVTQFALSIILIIGTTVVYNQLDYLKNKNLGFDKEHLLYIVMRGDIGQSYQTLKSELLNQPEVAGVTASSHRPAMIGSNSGGAMWDGKDPESNILISHNRIDYDYIETLKISMVEGRSFSKDFPSDFGTDSTGGFLVNEELVKLMDVESAVGANFSFLGRKGKIVGVMKNFHFHSLRVDIEPLALVLAPPEDLGCLTIRIQPGNISSTIDKLRDTWKKVIPGYPFEFRFVDEDIDSRYRAEERMGDLLKYFTLFAIFISCLGLFGLASFMAEQRTKEIGVRKVLGASVSNIVTLLSKEFTKWVLLANIIAWPVAYFVMTNWLQKFAFRIDLGWGMFFLAGFLSLVIAVVTVSFQAIKSAITNPAEALRYE